MEFYFTISYFLEIEAIYCFGTTYQTICPCISTAKAAKKNQILRHCYLVFYFQHKQKVYDQRFINHHQPNFTLPQMLWDK